MEHIADRLVKSIKDKKSPIVIGLDPVYENLPTCIKSKYSQDIDGAAQAFLEFGNAIIDAVCDIVPAIKPQSAFYELLGYRGVKAMEKSVAYAKSKGLIIIDDSKRGDIGNTSKAYAEAHIGSFAIDGKCIREADSEFMTVSPFLGLDGVQPFVEAAKRNNKGAFVLVRTSNPASALVQSALTEAGKTVSAELAEYVAEEASKNLGIMGYSSIGAVVGATYPAEAKAFREVMRQSFFLVPGYGAQGATAKDIVPFFNPDGLGALINASRSVIYAYKNTCSDDCSTDELKDVTRAAAEVMHDDIYGELRNSFKNLVY